MVPFMTLMTFVTSKSKEQISQHAVIVASCKLACASFLAGWPFFFFFFSSSQKGPQGRDFAAAGELERENQRHPKP
jgi:hypothetical protein